MDQQPHYSMAIQWSDEDHVYIVSFPEWEAHGLIGHTHGATYDEAVRKGQEVLHMLVDSAREVLKISRSQLKPPPPLLDEGATGFVRAVAQVGPRMVMVIDFAKVIGEEPLDVA